MSDHYTRVVLTIIAAALAIIAVGQLIPRADAQMGMGCGVSITMPCYVAASGGLEVRSGRSSPVEVRIMP